MDRIALPEGEARFRRVDFEPVDAYADTVHLLSRPEIHAVNASIAAGRPLLVQGEPGTGKSQLARAAAKQLGWAFVKHVIDSQTESRDLLWTFDAVQRLADAQITGLRPAAGGSADGADARLAVDRYVQPGPLWWAFAWDDAAAQADRSGSGRPPQRDSGDWGKGCVVLIDEIDKAESEVPNGLLEALGAREFTPIGRRDPVRLAPRPLLVVITTNEERTLPDAFLRRCLVVRLQLDEDDDALIAFLMERGLAHFPQSVEAVRREAAKMLCADRRSATAAQVRPRPGQAEYLDLLRIVLNLEPDKPAGQLALLADVAGFALKKQAGADPLG